MSTSETIDHHTLTRLVEAGAVRSATVIGQPGGWGVVVQYGMTERAIAVKRGPVRVWRRFETLASYLKDMGLNRYQVDAANYSPESPKASTPKRPDAAERMRRAHEAAAYDEWLRGKVEASRNDPRPSISNDDMKAEFAKRRAALRAKAMQ
ncbi:antitoxin PaaA2 family protein [Castellaniella caeni]|uniref:antitoxin PaaA2 family protein n=1 Tax=Castellaniella caeni TaxID=266123 RepID=UPI000833598E|nr:hypothetical protein [Castellaniella caeni]